MPYFDEVVNCDRPKINISGLAHICCSLRAGCCVATLLHQWLSVRFLLQGLHNRILGVVVVEAGYPSVEGLASKTQPSAAMLALHIESSSESC